METFTNCYKFCAMQKQQKSLVIYAHLWLEHLMVRCIVAVLPNPDALFSERALSFYMLIALCETHNIMTPELAQALRLVNGLRNKCAHKANYEPRMTDLALNHPFARPRKKRSHAPFSFFLRQFVHLRSHFIQDRSQTEVAQRFQGPEENSSCPIAKTTSFSYCPEERR
jgi:hypothetical protein